MMDEMMIEQDEIVCGDDEGMDADDSIDAGANETLAKVKTDFIDGVIAESDPEWIPALMLFKEHYARLVYIAAGKYRGAPHGMVANADSEAKILVMRVFDEEVYAKGRTSWDIAGFVETLKRRFIDEVRSYRNAFLPLEERKESSKENEKKRQEALTNNYFTAIEEPGYSDQYSVRFHTTGSSDTADGYTHSAGEMIEDYNEAAMRGIDDHKLTAEKEAEWTDPLRIQDWTLQVIKRRWMEDLLERLLADDDAYLNKKQRAEIVAMSFGIGSEDGEGLKAPEIDAKLGLKTGTAKNTIAGALLHMRREFASKPALMIEYSEMMKITDAHGTTDAVKDYAYEIQDAMMWEKPVPPIERLYWLRG